MSRTVDMTRGSEWNHIVKFTVPLLCGNVLQQMYNIVDTMVVGKYLGDNALAAVGATGSITYLFYSLCIGLSIGAGIVISWHFGARRDDLVRKTIYNSALLLGVFGLVLSLAGAGLARMLLTFLGTPAHLLDTASSYMRMACLGTIAVAFYNWINAVLRSLGDSKTPLIFLGVASVLNIILDLLFVIPLHMGATGAALATVLAQGTSAVLSILYAIPRFEQLRLKKEDRVRDNQVISQCLRSGIPIALQNAIISVSMIGIQSVTNGFGKNVMAAYTTGMRIEQFVHQPFNSLNAALATFTGQNIGARREDRVKQGMKVGVTLSIGYSILIMLCFIFFGKSLVSCFINGEKSISIAAASLCITSACYIPLGMIYTFRGILNGAGDNLYAVMNGVTEVVCRISFAVILTKIAAIGYWGIWITTDITWFATGLVSILRYAQGKWKQ